MNSFHEISRTPLGDGFDRVCYIIDGVIKVRRLPHLTPEQIEAFSKSYNKRHGQAETKEMLFEGLTK